MFKWYCFLMFLVGKIKSFNFSPVPKSTLRILLVYKMKHFQKTCSSLSPPEKISSVYSTNEAELHFPQCSDPEGSETRPFP